MSERSDRLTASHAGSASQRALSVHGHDNVGEAGEKAFSAMFKVPITGFLKSGTDGGKDFVINNIRIDVKCAAIPHYLLLEEGKPAAEVLVLAHYLPKPQPAKLLGWALGVDVKAAPVKDIGGLGIKSHYIKSDRLRPMPALWLYLGLEEPPLPPIVRGPSKIEQKTLWGN